MNMSIWSLCPTLWTSECCWSEFYGTNDEMYQQKPPDHAFSILTSASNAYGW